VAEDLKRAGTRLGARVLTIYGGRAYEPQIEALTAGIDIVVGTPGRLLDLANRKNLDLSQIRALVLDEADKMLDLGFLPDVERLLRLTPADRPDHAVLRDHAGRGRHAGPPPHAQADQHPRGGAR